MVRIAILCSFCLLPLCAQSDFTSLSGTVADPSPAAVRDARVTLRNLATGAVRETRSDESGFYQFTLLAPGTYEIAVEAPGFQLFRDTGVTLKVAQPARLDVELLLGHTSQSVTVTGTVSALVADTAAQGTVIGQEKIAALPLNGRQFLQLALLAPGANPGGRAVQQNQIRQGFQGSFSASGGRSNNNAFLLDGAANTDVDYNMLNFAPVVDSIAEFQVQTSLYSAEYGRASGAQINVVTKSGGNELHGSAWEFLRNDRLDARPFNLPSSRLPKYRRNQFGATLGGPFVKNRLFGFFAYEGLRVRQAAAALTSVNVPTELQRAADFRATRGGIFDPDTLSGGVRLPFPDNRIPASRINPLSLAAMKPVPLPNVPGTTLFVNAEEVLTQNAGNYSLRVDGVASERWNVFGRYSIAEENATVPEVTPGRGTQNNGRPQNAVAGSTLVLSPNLVNETRLAFNRMRLLSGLPEPLFEVAGQKRELPRFLPAGYPTMGGAGGFSTTASGGIAMVRNNNFQVYNNLSWRRGRHSVKAGCEVFHIRYNREEAGNPLGSYQFTNGFTTRTARNDGTGDALASFLLGMTTNAQRSVGPRRMDGRQTMLSLYLQDDVRLSRDLTLNAGLRYELAPPLYDIRNQAANVDYSRVPSPAAIFAEGRTAFYRPLLFLCGTDGYPKGCAHTDYNNLSPRLGLAWKATARTVLRAGAGIYYAANDTNPLFRLVAGLPNSITQTLTSDLFVPRYRGYDIFGPAVVGPTAIQGTSIDLFQRTSYTPQWSFSLQRELARDLVLEAGYLATLGIKLEQNVHTNNALPGPGNADPRRPYGGLSFAPGLKFPQDMVVTRDFVPLSFANHYPKTAQSNYHALLVKLEKRFSGGFSLLSSYSFSKAITNAPQLRNAGGASGAENTPPQNPYDLRAERGLAAYHASSRWVNSFVLDPPFGRGRRFLKGGVPAAVLGGWRASGILAMQTGFPFSVNVAGDTAGQGSGAGGVIIRPNLVPGAGVALPSSERTPARFFNTAAFTLPPPYTFGNVGRNTVIGPGLVNLDFGLARQVRLSERLRLEGRGEAFNLFNRPNYNIVGRIISDTATFGRVRSQLDPRQIQFGLKLLF